MPGTELGFEDEITVYAAFSGHKKRAKTAIFRQIRKDEPRCHHDALELPDGELVMLTNLWEGQRCRVLQLPAAPKTEAEVKEQTRAEFVG